jgi:hypothetical protein
MRLLYLALIAACICGCSNWGDESAAEAALRQEIDGQSQGHIKLVSFAKTDGQSGNVSGVDVRQIDYTAWIEFEQNGTWLSGGWPGRLAYSFTSEIYKPRSELDALNSAGSGPVVVNAQGRAQIKGTMVGTKKDSGWQFQTSASVLVTPLVSR